MKSHHLRATVALVAALTTLTACLKTDPDTPETLGDSANHIRTVQLISHVTDGLVARDTEVSVRFSAAHEERLDDAGALAAAFTFTPPVAGSAEWIDERTIVFSPREVLRTGTHFQCVLDVAAVLPSTETIKPFAFDFTVAPNRILTWEVGLEPAHEDDPQQMIVSGQLDFSDTVDFDDLGSHVELRSGRSLIALEWRSDVGESTLWFSSEPIPRGDHPQQLVMTIPAQPFGIEADLTRSIELRPLDDLGVVDVVLHDEDREPRLSIELSDPLSEKDDLGSYVRVEPGIQLRVSAVGSSLLVSGPFQRGQDYQLIIRHGLPSRWGARLQEDVQRTVQFVDLKPKVEFSQTGALLPSRSQRTIGFRTVNVREITVSVMQVFETNLGQFLQEYDLASGKNRSRLWGALNRVGVTVTNETLEIGDTRNAWIQSTLDLSKLVEDRERGLFLVTLGFDRSQLLYDCEDNRRYPYWDHPCGDGYADNYGTVVKPVVLTDIGLLAKRGADSTLVAATHLATAAPLPGVDLTLVSYQNQPIEHQRTDADGLAEFSTGEGFFLEGRWDGQRTALKFSESELSLSGFEVGGATGSAQPTRAFIYTDRGVYRPGHTIHLAAIVRHQDESFPDGHPLSLKVRNPRDQVVHEQVNRQGLAGHYAFEVTTSDSDPTGTWIADLYNGESLLASHKLRVETVVPNRLKVRLELDATTFGPEKPEHQIGLRSSYLFGAPASHLLGSLDVSYSNTEKSFDAYPDYSFRHPARRFAVDDENLFDDNLDADGAADIRWALPDLEGAPSALTATLTARVFERGGRPTTNAQRVTIDPYDAYVGVRRLETRWVRLNEALPLTTVLVHGDGSPVAGRTLEVNVYHNDRYWWWEYRSDNDSTLRFKTDVGTVLLDSRAVTTGTAPLTVELLPDRKGQILVEVRDTAGGHASGLFLWASSWGDQGAPLEAGTQLDLEVDRERFHPGEVARITATTPAEGLAFVSVEKGGRILDHKWVELEGSSTTIDLPVTAEMLPNAYLHVMVIQPHAQTANDRPMRLYGVIPIAVEQESTRLPVEVEAPSQLKPRAPFEVEVRVPDRRPATVTVAVVDEGLLDLTSFETPDPWLYFFAKERLSVATYDVFDSVIGALWGEVRHHFAIGGDEDSFGSKRTRPAKANRFPPVALFSPPVATDDNGIARFSFEMPQYMGSVRVMAVATSGASFGHAEATVPVREAMVLLPTLPRVVGPDERFQVPVTLFCLENGLGTAEVEITATQPLAVSGPSRATVTCEKGAERDIDFEVVSIEAAGVATVRVAATAGRSSTWSETELAVRPVNPHIFDSKELIIAPKGHAELTVPALGLDGTRGARLQISTLPGMNFGHRLQSLIRYPYGCMEQTMSAVFPQLELKTLLAAEQGRREVVSREVDRNINAGIQRLRKFQTADGGFASWPGGGSADLWSTNYAGHFLIEAQSAGYHVPQDLWNAWTRFQRQRATREAGDLKTQCYRLFLLALAEKPEVGAMNLLREEQLTTLDNTCKWLLAAAYSLSGLDDAARSILAIASTEVAPYRERGGTYGSDLRDKAVLLYLAALLERPQIALELYQEINTALSARSYLSTQEGGFSLLAAGRYLRSAWQQDADIRGGIEIDNGVFKRDLDQAQGVVSFDLGEHIGKQLEIVSRSEVPLYAVLEWQGIPVSGPTEALRKNLEMEVQFLDEDGQPVDPTTMPQGSMFWCHVRLGSSHRSWVENVALTQILPSGWEIEASRLRGETAPAWADNLRLGQETYSDIRDDRVMWFFDLQGSRDLDFLVKILTVTRGSFVLAPTYAEAMYDHAFRALEPGRPVEVVGSSK